MAKFNMTQHCMTQHNMDYRTFLKGKCKDAISVANDANMFKNMLLD